VNCFQVQELKVLGEPFTKITGTAVPKQLPANSNKNPASAGLKKIHTVHQPANRSRTLEDASCDESGCFGLLAGKAFLASISHALNCFRVDAASFNALFFRVYA
jgi:hypothetical protein